MHLPPGEPPDGDRGVATPPTSDAAVATEIACDAELDLPGADVDVADGIGHTNEPSADDGVDRKEYVVPLAAADDPWDDRDVPLGCAASGARARPGPVPWAFGPGLVTPWRGSVFQALFNRRNPLCALG